MSIQSSVIAHCHCYNVRPTIVKHRIWLRCIKLLFYNGTPIDCMVRVGRQTTDNKTDTRNGVTRITLQGIQNRLNEECKGNFLCMYNIFCCVKAQTTEIGSKCSTRKVERTCHK